MYDIKSPDIWFFETQADRNGAGIPALRPLAGQFAPDGKGGFELIDHTLKVKANSAIRNANPIGTVFFSRTLGPVQATSAGGGKFYDTGTNTLTVVSTGTTDVKEAYGEYLKYVGAPDPEEVTGVPKPASPKMSLLDKLLDKFPAPTVLKHEFFVEKDIWACLLLNLELGYNTMLVGPSGSGKTELVMMLSQMIGKKLNIFDMAAKQDPIASLIGVHRFDGKSVFDRADFTKAIEEDCIVLLDELPRAPMNTNNILFPVLDSRRELKMDIASSELRSIKVHDECRFIATANEGYEYTGNNVLDRALKERFQVIPVDYAPETHEVNLLVAKTGVGKADAQMIVKIAKQIRGQHMKEDLSTAVSIRHTQYAAKLTVAGMNLAKAMEIAYLPMFAIEDEKKKVKDLLASR